MKIAFISAGGYMDKEDYVRGNLLGTEYQIFGLSKELAKRGHEVYILRKWYKSIIENVENIKIWGFKSTDYRKSGLRLTFSKLRFSRIAAEAIKDEGFNILVIIDPFTSYFTFKLSVPKVLVTHSQIPYELLPPEVLTNKNFLLRKIRSIIQRNIFNNADVIVALNSTIRDYLKSSGYKAISIPNGIEIENYTPRYLEDGCILYGGRLVRSKGCQYLIKAYSLLDKKLQDKSELVIIGFGPENGNLKDLALKLGINNKVRFIPWLPNGDFIKKMESCSVFVLPSLYETFGVVILEAMASGKPVIVSNIPGPKDIITHGYNGFLFEKGNASELKEYLELLLSDEKLRKKIGENARKTVEEKYTITKIADEYLKLFNDLVGDRNAHR